MYKSKDIQENSLFVLNLDSDQFPINGLFGTLKLVFVHISHWQLPVLTVQGLSGGRGPASSQALGPGQCCELLSPCPLLLTLS